MATVGGLSNGASNSVSMYGASIKGYGGLASGLDTDSLIEGMTVGTRTKIQEALKQKQTYQWEMDAYRSVSDQLIALNSKYLNVTSSSSPYRTSFFDRSMVTAHGAFSKYLSVSGASGALDNMSVLGIKQLAKDSSLVSKQNNSIKELNTAGIDFGEDVDISKLEGGNLSIKYGNYTYNISMNSGNELFGAGATGTNTTDFSTGENTMNTINAMLKNTKVMGTPEGEDVYLSDRVRLNFNGGKFSLLKMGGADADEELSLSGGSEEALKLMGFMDDKGNLKNEGVIMPGTGLEGDKTLTGGDFITTESFAKFMGGKVMTFNYNGSGKMIKFPSEEEIQRDWIDPAGGDKTAGLQNMATYLTKELGKAFGTGKVKVEVEPPATPGGNPSFSFTTPDESSILRITNADAGLMGKLGVFGIGHSTTNRLNPEVPLMESGLKLFGGGWPTDFGKYTLTEDPAGSGRAKKVYELTDYNDKDGNLYININGEEIKGLKIDSTLAQFMSAVNDSGAGVKMNYNETADRISMMSTNQGESGTIDISAANGMMTNPDDPTGPLIPTPDNFLKLLVGDAKTDYTYIQGQDAIMTVKYEGNVETDIKRDSNSFKLDGSTFTLNTVFGFESAGLVDSLGNVAPNLFEDAAMQKPYKGQVKVGADGITTIPPVYYDDGGGGTLVPVNGAPEGSLLYQYKYTATAGTEAVTFTSAVDTEKVVKVIGEMIEEYNKIADLANKLVGTKPDRDYGPLTDDEKSGLNQDQITQLENKAKEGILFNDPLLRSLTDRMRSVFSGVADVGTLSNMGMTVSNSWKDNGKISFDAEKFKNALLEDSEKVKKLFTDPLVKDSQGTVTNPGGISVRLKTITEDFANVTSFTKGSLIEKAGSIASPTSVLQNALKKLMDDVDKDVKSLKKKLQVEIDRYSKQFSSLEQLISQMNSQSSWFTQSMGG